MGAGSLFSDGSALVRQAVSLLTRFFAGGEPDPEAQKELPDLPGGFSTPTEKLYIDYNL
jgi:hypothetical protein